MNLNPVGVLNVHAQLASRMQCPSADLADFIRYHMQRNLSDHGYTMSFYPVIPQGPDVIPTVEHGGQLARLLGRGLAKAVTYQVTAGMVADMRATYDNAMRDIDHIDEREIPSPAGFAWLDDPWRIGTSDGGFLARALSWEFTETWSNDGGEHLLPCARMSLWRHDTDTTAGERATSQLGPLVLTHTTLMPFGLRFSKPRNPADHESTASFLGLIHLLWIYLGMEITSSEKRGIPVGTRKRAQKSIRHAEVRVVLLRRITGVTEPGDGQSSTRFYSCRWPVQGHYRHQERPADGHHAIASGTGKHCTACAQELTWVRAYLKGPDGLPLRASDKTVFKLAR